MLRKTTRKDIPQIYYIFFALAETIGVRQKFDETLEGKPEGSEEQKKSARLKRKRKASEEQKKLATEEEEELIESALKKMNQLIRTFKGMKKVSLVRKISKYPASRSYEFMGTTFAAKTYDGKLTN